MNWVICNIDDLTESEKEYLNNYIFYRLFSGLFVMSKEDLDDWKFHTGFDDWVMKDFPEGYITNGWLSEDIDHNYQKITNFIYEKNAKLFDKFIDILENNHKTKTIEDIEIHILEALSKWNLKEFQKFDNNSDKIMEWLANEITKVLK